MTPNWPKLIGLYPLARGGYNFLIDNGSYGGETEMVGQVTDLPAALRGTAEEVIKSQPEFGRYWSLSLGWV